MSWTVRRSSSSGIPVPCRSHQPDPHALAWPRRRRSASSGVDRAGSSATRCGPSSKPAALAATGAAARRRRTRRCRSAGRRARARPRPAGGVVGPGRTATRRPGRRPRRRAARSTTTHEQHPARGPVVGAAPAADRAVRVAQHDVLAGQVAARGDLDQQVVLGGAGPAAAALSWRRSSSVSSAASSSSGVAGGPAVGQGRRARPGAGSSNGVVVGGGHAQHSPVRRRGAGHRAGARAAGPLRPGGAGLLGAAAADGDPLLPGEQVDDGVEVGTARLRRPWAPQRPSWPARRPARPGDLQLLRPARSARAPGPARRWRGGPRAAPGPRPRSRAAPRRRRASSSATSRSRRISRSVIAVVNSACSAARSANMLR